jgi:hypothetical protein
VYIRGCGKLKGMEMDGITPIPATLSINNYLINPPKTSVIIEIDPKTAKSNFRYSKFEKPAAKTE